MCELLVQNAIQQFKTTTFTLKPLTIAPVLRDLIVDLARAYERVHKAKPYIIEPAETPRREMNLEYRPGLLNVMLRPLDVSIVFVARRPVSAVTDIFWFQMP